MSEMSSFIEKSDFNTFKNILDGGGRVKGIICPNSENYSRKVIDELTDYLVKYFRVKGLAWMKCNSSSMEGGINKFFSKDFRLDASSDTLLLENDPDLKYLREVTDRYGSKDFLILTYTPNEPMISEVSLNNLLSLKYKIQSLNWVHSTITLLDVPLLNNSDKPLSTVTALLDPPPSPAPMGIFLFIDMLIP